MLSRTIVRSREMFHERISHVANLTVVLFEKITTATPWLQQLPPRSVSSTQLQGDTLLQWKDVSSGKARLLAFLALKRF